MGEIDEDKLTEACEFAYERYYSHKERLEYDKRRSDIHYKLRRKDIELAIDDIIATQIALAEFRGQSTSGIAEHYKKVLSID